MSLSQSKLLKFFKRSLEKPGSTEADVPSKKKRHFVSGSSGGCSSIAKGKNVTGSGASETIVEEEEILPPLPEDESEAEVE